MQSKAVVDGTDSVRKSRYQTQVFEEKGELWRCTLWDTYRSWIYYKISKVIFIVSASVSAAVFSSPPFSTEEICPLWKSPRAQTAQFASLQLAEVYFLVWHLSRQLLMWLSKVVFDSYVNLTLMFRCHWTYLGSKHQHRCSVCRPQLADSYLQPHTAAAETTRASFNWEWCAHLRKGHSGGNHMRSPGH